MVKQANDQQIITGDPGGRIAGQMKRSLLAVVVAFVLSRIVFLGVMGVTFDPSPLNRYWQYIDPYLLRNNLWESVYYLHSQPPLFNLFLGVVLNLCSGNEVVAFQSIYICSGLILTIALFVLMLRLGVHEILAAGLTIAFVVSPAAIIYENWLFYDYPLAVMLCVAALALHLFAASSKTRYALLFFVLLACVVLVRSLFHVLWMVLIMVFLMWSDRSSWRRIVKFGAVPLIIVLLLYAKNFYTFGIFSSSSWAGMSLWKMTINRLEPNDVKLLIDRGEIDRISQITTFSKVEAYKPFLQNIPTTNVPVLDQELKTNGNPNFNHIAYIEVSERYLKDSLHVLRSSPSAFWKSVRRSYYLYFLPSSDYFVFFYNGSRQKVKTIDKIYNLLIYGQLEYNEDDPRHGNVRWSRTGIFLIIMFVCSFLYGLYVLIKEMIWKCSDRSFYMTVGFIWIILVYVTLVGNFLEEGENNRFRIMIDPLSLVIFGLFLTRLARMSSSYLTKGYHMLRGLVQAYSVREP